MKKTHLNSYLKLAIIIIVSGLIGGILGFITSYFHISIAHIFNMFISLIQYHANIIMWILTIIAAAICIACYRKSEQILQDFLKSDDDEEQELLDRKYDFWGTFGISFSNIILCLSIVLFAFPFTIFSEVPWNFFVSLIIAFLLCMLICSVYQIAIVKQMKRKDPVKYDDAMSFDFQNKYLKTCDEGERQLIYQSSYKAFQLTSKLMMFMLVIALLAHVQYGNGLLAIVLLGGLYIIMMTSYSIYSLKLQKLHINE